MKKLLAIIVLSLLWNINVYSNDWNTRINEKIYDEFKVNKKMKLPLDSGEWILIAKDVEMITHGIGVSTLTFVQLENNTPIKFFEISRATGLSKWQAYLTSIIEGAVFHAKEGGCMKRQNYNYLNFYKRGSAHNCMTVEMLDVARLLYPSDYDSDRVFTLGIRQWIKKNNIELPNLFLMYSGTFFSRVVRDEWYTVMHAVSPEKFANYKPKFTSRDSTEFHPDNIKNYIKAKSIMKDWIEYSANKHKEFEDFQKSKNHQRLDLSSIIQITSTVNKNIKSNKNISNQLIKLNELYQSGALTKEEFTKAKKKLLN
ncbi:SHOCT domain-containing protein [Pelagibacteraceae bacterium]|nr:SHOCT domain-containing protein [Pelagibacteraceae bacterium]MDC0511790.1 SHOCT domain-containing protein [Pelagibacteraceae bacterium]